MMVESDKPCSLKSPGILASGCHHQQVPDHSCSTEHAGKTASGPARGRLGDSGGVHPCVAGHALCDRLAQDYLR